MVRSDLACSGVMFTIDTETGFRDAVLINAAWGLGENVVQGSVNPGRVLCLQDHAQEGISARSSKAARQQGIQTDLRRRRRPHDEERPRPAAGPRVGSRSTTTRFSTGAVGLHRSKTTIRRSAAGHVPMDMEWAKDGRTGELFIVQARPETVQSLRAQNVLETYQLRKKGRVLARAAASARRSPPAGAGDTKSAAFSSSFRRAKCSSPTRPIPTGSRS
jgi:pyruvate, water dikinase